MKKYLLLLIIAFFSASSYAKDEFSYPRIGVVENQYDHVEKLLQKMKIPFSMIKYRNLENESMYSSYDVIFFPCGAEMPLNSSVNILSRGIHIEGVSLSEQYYKIDMKKTGSYVASFIKNGGSAYVTDFSYRYLHEGFNSFSFYKDFPFLGLPGQIKSKVHGELLSYLPSPNVSLNFTHSGWIVPAEIMNSELLLSAECETPLGPKKSPIISLISEGKGTAVFSSYHDSADTYGIMRYLIFRTIFKNEADAAYNYAAKWEQKIHSLVVDRVVSGEPSRTYSLKLKKGENYIYFKTSGGEWLIDLFDNRGVLIFSGENSNPEFKYNIKSHSEDRITAKIIPIGTVKPVSYTITSVSGMRLIPYFIHIALGVLAFIILVFYAVFLKQNRSRGRIHLPGSG